MSKLGIKKILIDSRIEELKVIRHGTTLTCELVPNLNFSWEVASEELAAGTMRKVFQRKCVCMLCVFVRVCVCVCRIMLQT